ncbi:MAG: hypothetical protein LBV73_31155 [Paraburkholderia sp.]|jgi:hypothetical protein|nr:hypothetical protein [Paraburkholderia sp.]
MMMRTETETRRKRYAMHRLRLAMQRLIQADAAHERTMATRWVIAWGAAVGERRFAGSSSGRYGRHASGGHALAAPAQSGPLS